MERTHVVGHVTSCSILTGIGRELAPKDRVRELGRATFAKAARILTSRLQDATFACSMSNDGDNDLGNFDVREYELENSLN